MTTPPHTRILQPWLTVARAIWLVTAILAVGLYIVSIQWPDPKSLPACTTAGAGCDPLGFSQEDMAQLPSGALAEAVSVGTFGIDLIFNLSYVVVGLLIFWRRSDDWMAWLLSLSLLMLGSYGFSTANELLAALTRSHLIADVLNGFTYGSLLLLILIFPNGRFAPTWVGVLIIGLVTAAALDLNGLDILPFSLEIPAIVGVIILAVYSLGYRYRRVSNALERQQTKWGAFGLSSGLFIMALWGLLGFVFPPEHPSPTRTYFLLGATLLVGFFGVLFPVCIAIAALKYRLYDIDLIIRRTLVYSTITALLALVYLGGVVILQNIFVGLTGQNQSQLVTVVTTLAIAALFFPLRNRVQNFVDRRFYRRKYDAAQTLAGFAATARDEVELEKLTAQLVQVVDETMQPEAVRLWITADQTGVAKK